ncbi:MAG: amidase [Verrucomicrobiota bacterium]
MPSFAEYDRFDALGLAALVKRREVSARELLEAAIARVTRDNPAINAVGTRLYDRGLATIERGPADGPFSGVPLLLKDLGAEIRGYPTNEGCSLFAGSVANHDSEIVRRHEAAGFVIFGKTHTSELGLSTSTESRLCGPTRNPWDRTRSAGGSSGGAAAAVAAGIVPLAHASDGGGSIRIPASCCGLFGLKPTRARTPMGPLVAEGWAGFSVVHAITRSVRDSAALLDATQGPDVGDPYWAPPPARPYSDEVAASPGRLRIAVTTSAWNGHAVDPHCVEAVRLAAKLCEDLGHHVEPASPAIDSDALGRASRLIISANVRTDLERRARALGRAYQRDDVETITWKMAEFGRTVSAEAYIEAIGAAQKAGRELGDFFLSYDVLLTPTQCTPPLPLGILDMMTEDTRRFGDAIAGTMAFTSLFNMTGSPAMSLPLHATPDGLPVGVQFAAPFGDEAVLFRLAAQLEAARPWADRKPDPG